MQRKLILLVVTLIMLSTSLFAAQRWVVGEVFSQNG